MSAVVRQVTIQDQVYDVILNGFGEEVAVNVGDGEHNNVALKTLSFLDVEWQYRDIPVNGHYMDDEGDVWFFRDGKGVYFANSQGWDKAPLSLRTFTKCEPEF